MTRKVLISCIQLQRTIDEHRAMLEAGNLELILPRVRGQQLGEQEMVALVQGVEGIIAGDDVINRAVLDHADALRVVSKWGVGVDNIDVGGAAERGVRIMNTPGAFGDEVADVVVGYLVLLARQLHVLDRNVRAGAWPKPVGLSLAGRTIGIVGLGDIGREVARRCIAMRMRVVGVEPAETAATAAARDGIEIMSLASVLKEADVVSLNCPLTAATRHMIDTRAIGAMRPGAWLINTARGGLVDERALIQALEDGRLGGAALDVFAQEPLPANSRLRALDNVILGSHNSSNTAEAVHRTSVRAIENLLEGLGRSST